MPETMISPHTEMYPSSDGLPMSENMKQFRWIVMIKENLEVLFHDREDVLVAGDHLIYPVEGQPKIRIAPDAYVAFGRPKGDRGSYQVWNEGGIFPQVVFEVLSPNNTPEEMDRKCDLYSEFGAQEYYVYDPDRNRFEAWLRRTDRLRQMHVEDRFVSPLLGITFELAVPELVIRYPDGRPFRTMVELNEYAEEQREQAEQERQRVEAVKRELAQMTAEADYMRSKAEAEKQRAEAEKQRAEAEKQRAEAEKQRAEAEKQRAEAEKQRAEELAAKLRSLGIDPDQN